MLGLYRSGRQGEALSLFRDTSRLLAEELGVDPGPALQEMHRRILAADQALSLDGPSRQPSRPPSRPPAASSQSAQLPADYPDFVGRAEQVARLSRRLTRPDAMPVVGIAGLAGVGKTALAVHVGHAVRSHFPDGQVFVNLTGADDERLDPHGVLGFLLRTFGIPGAELPDSVGQRAALWRSLLSGRRVLVILDDAQDSAQIGHLLAGAPGCAVIVTSQRRLVEVPGVRWLKLDVLRPDEAIMLFEEIAGRDRIRRELDPAKRLAASFSHLPLPIRMAASRLNARPHWGVAAVEQHLYEELRHSTELQDDCAAAAAPFERAHRRLDPRLARAFRLIALAEAPDISASTAAASLGSTEDEAEKILESLADLHLLEIEGLGRYRYHNLVREFARYLAFRLDGPDHCDVALRGLVRLRRVTPGRLYAVS
jgi:hypothetical protein